MSQFVFKLSPGFLALIIPGSFTTTRCSQTAFDRQVDYAEDVATKVQALDSLPGVHSAGTQVGVVLVKPSV